MERSDEECAKEMGGKLLKIEAHSDMIEVYDIVTKNENIDVDRQRSCALNSCIIILLKLSDRCATR